MTEQLLQFIWGHRYFNQQELQLVSGEDLRIDLPGMQNTNQGPDFLDAQIRIGSTAWVGSVELHLYTSGWRQHAHEQDANYNNVILHVVWVHDQTMPARDIPVLELQPRVAKRMLLQYAGWMKSKRFIPCEHSIGHCRESIWRDWQQKLLTERLARKATSLDAMLAASHFHWEETLWRLLARNFGMKVNAAAFESIATSIPFALLARFRGEPMQVEALLLGQAGLLDADCKDEYPRRLQHAYRFLQHKFQLAPIAARVLFLRMRPENFPTIRLSQLAVICYRIPHFFALLKETQRVETLVEKLLVTASDYWNDHYLFDKPAVYKEKGLGRQMAENLVINTLVPILYQYAVTGQHPVLRQKCLDWLQELPAECNGIIDHWQGLGISSRHAGDTQSLLELKSQYCDLKRCLDCAVGRELLR